MVCEQFLIKMGLIRVKSCDAENEVMARFHRARHVHKSRRDGLGLIRLLTFDENASKP